MTHKFVSKQTISGSDNGLLPGRRQAIICTNAGISLIRPLGTNFNAILSETYIYIYIYIYKFKGPTWAHLGPVGPRCVPCRPHAPCYLGCFALFCYVLWKADLLSMKLKRTNFYFLWFFFVSFWACFIFEFINYEINEIKIWFASGNDHWYIVDV